MFSALGYRTCVLCLNCATWYFHLPATIGTCLLGIGKADLMWNNLTLLFVILSVCSHPFIQNTKTLEWHYKLIKYEGNKLADTLVLLRATFRSMLLQNQEFEARNLSFFATRKTSFCMDVEVHPN